MPYTIEEIRQKAAPVARSFGIKSMNLFGSYARGGATGRSDIDLCIDKGKLKGLIQYFSFVLELEKTFGCHVDVVTTGIADHKFLEAIMREGVLPYEE